MLGCAFKSLTDRLTDKPLLECVEGSCEGVRECYKYVTRSEKRFFKNAKK